MSSRNIFQKVLVFCQTLSLLVFPLALLLISPAQYVKAETLEELNNKKLELEYKAKQAEKAAKEQLSTAQRAEQKVNELNTEISGLQNNIVQTESSISDTNTKISNKNQEIAQLEAELRKTIDQQDALIRQMYIMRKSAPDALLYFSDEPISQREQRQAQMTALKKSVSALITKTQVAKAEVEKNRSELVKHNEELALYKAQQDEQKRGLANYRYEQSALQDNAEAAMAEYDAKAKKARSEAAAVEEKIRAVLAARTANSKGVFGTGPGVGQRVKKGDFVGIQGSTGFSTGDHVHFEVDLSGPANGFVSPWSYLNSGAISWPLSNFVITQNYGEKNSWYACGYHMGIDIAGPIGSPVYAPADGMVVLNEWFGGYGNAWAMKVDNGPYVLMGHLRR